MTEKKKATQATEKDSSSTITKKATKKTKVIQRTSRIFCHNGMVYGMKKTHRFFPLWKLRFYIPVEKISAIKYGVLIKIKLPVLAFSLLPLFFFYVAFVDDGMNQNAIISLIIAIIIVMLSIKVGRSLIINSAQNQISIPIGRGAKKSTQDLMNHIVNLLTVE